MHNEVKYNEQLHRNLIKELDFEDSVMVHKLKDAVLKSVLIFYSQHTARETCEMFGIPFKPEFVKILHRLSPKGLGLGGARQGAGVRKN